MYTRLSKTHIQTYFRTWMDHVADEMRITFDDDGYVD